MKTQWVSATISILLIVGIGATEACGKAESPQTTAIVPWKQLILDNLQDAQDLSLARHFPQEHSKYFLTQILTDHLLWIYTRRNPVPPEAWPVRPFVAALQGLVGRSPNSPFADDAALILARGRMYWYNDANGALQELLKVVQAYPAGHWIAENEQFDVYIAGSTSMVSDSDPSPGVQSAILNYIAVEQPNSTVDEAYMTIAMFYREGFLLPAEKQVEYYKKVLERHAGRNRFAEDLKFVERISYHPEGYQKRIVRHEDEALLSLVRYYRSQGDFVNALDYGRQYIAKINGYPFRCRQIYPAMIAMEESLGHSEAAATYRQKLAEAEQLWKQDQQRYGSKEYQEKMNKRKDRNE